MFLFLGSELVKSSSDALSLLDKVPGLTTNRLSNSVAITGEQNVLVLVNNMLMRDGTNLSNIRPQNIEKIEIISNPGARYDAEYTGVINIILKQKVEKGFKADLNLGYFGNNHNNSSVNLEYGLNNKVRLFSTYTVYYRNHAQYTDLERTYYDNEDTTYTKSYYSSRNPFELGGTILTGLDYFLNDNNNINISYSYDYYDLNKKAENQISTYSSNSDTEIALHQSKTIGDYRMNNLSGYYLHKFKNPSNLLELDINLYDMNFIDYTEYHITTSDHTEVNNETITNSKQSLNILLNQDLSINNNIDFSIGYNHYTRIFNNSHDKNVTLNEFKFREHRNAVYIESYFNYDKLSLSIGIRAEYSIQNISDSINNNLFEALPSIGISTPVNDNNTIQFSFETRLNRPDYRKLNPFLLDLDGLNWISGNPSLKPSKQYRFSLRYVIDSKFYLSTKAYIYQTNDLISLNSMVIDNINYRFWDNISNSTAYGINLNANFSVGDKISFYPYFNLNYIQFDKQYKDQNGYEYESSIYTNIELPHKFYLDLSISFQDKSISPQSISKQPFRISGIYLYRNIFKEKALIYTGISYPLKRFETKTTEFDINSTTEIFSETEFTMFIFLLRYSFQLGNNVKALDRTDYMEKDY
jgi:hypothetical protein